MNIDQASTFLACGILLSLGLTIIVIGIVAINNIIYKFWKPLKILTFTQYPPVYIEPTVEPEPTKEKEKKVQA